jgi:uncharacterized glyoxalase superfamily protein PhnB
MARDPFEAMRLANEPVVPSAELLAPLKRRVELIEQRGADMDALATDQRIIPYLMVGDARAAIEFYCEVFGAEQVGEPIVMDDGRVGHAELRFGGSTVYLADEFPELGYLGPLAAGAATTAFHVRVPDADVTFEHALAAGATAERPVQNQYGQRAGTLYDPWGHRWSPVSDEKPDRP